MITDHIRSHSMQTIVTHDHDAHSLIEGLAADATPPNTSRDAATALPTRHSLSVTFDTIR